MKMKKLKVNADDFGRHELINSAVKDAYINGICRNASLMAGEQAFDDAVRITRECPGLNVGIHFTLVMGSPVLPPSEIPSLVNDSGNFHDDFSVFVRKYLTGRILLSEVRSELSAQLMKIQNAGVNLSHADSHQHIHVLPGILNIVLDLSESAGIKTVRMPQVKGMSFSVGVTGLKVLSFLGKRLAKKRGFSFPDNFMGLVGGGSVNEEWLCKMLDVLPEGVTELMIHPGSSNRVLQVFSNWNHDFESELEAVKSQRVMKKLKLQGIEID